MIKRLVFLMIPILVFSRFIPDKSPRMFIPSHFPKTKDINFWMKNLMFSYPEYIKIVQYGSSVLGAQRSEKNLIALEICDKNSSPKFSVFFNAAIHSRELMSVYSLIKWIDELMYKVKKGDLRWQNYLKEVRLIVIPLVNPDGYDMVMKGWNWRKNCRVYKAISEWKAPHSYGVDLNRNFSKFFVSSPHYNHYTWGGYSAFSEPETTHLRDYLNKCKISLSLSLHAYGRYVSFPWWGNPKNKIPDYIRHIAIGKELKKKMPTYGLRTGCPYPISGNFGDWIYDKFRCITFSIEIGDSFNPDFNTSEKWYKEIKEGISFILLQATTSNKQSAVAE